MINISVSIGSTTVSITNTNINITDGRDYVTFPFNDNIKTALISAVSLMIETEEKEK